MLNDASLPRACRRFRVEFDAVAPGSDDGHCETCADCRAWVVHRRAVKGARSGRRPMPEALASRLRAIPECLGVCPKAEDLVRFARWRARGQNGTSPLTTPPVAGISRHVERCSRCRRLAGYLESALAFTLRPLPRRLERRLRTAGVRGPRRGLVWAFDLRIASLAAALIGLLLVPVAGPTAALARQAGGALAEPISGLRSGPAQHVSALALPAREKASRALARIGVVTESLAESWLDLAGRTRSVWQTFREIAASAADDNPGSGGQDDDD